MNKHLQQTGRTGRQMAEAINLSRKGFEVHYFVLDQGQVHEARLRLTKMCGIEPTVVEVSRIDWEDFDWEFMRPRSALRAHERQVWIVDHSVAESHYRNLTSEAQHIQRLMQQIYQYTTGAPAILHGVPPNFTPAMPTGFGGRARPVIPQPK